MDGRCTSQLFHVGLMYVLLVAWRDHILDLETESVGYEWAGVGDGNLALS